MEMQRIIRPQDRDPKNFLVSMTDGYLWPYHEAQAEKKDMRPAREEDVKAWFARVDELTAARERGELVVAERDPNAPKPGELILDDEGEGLFDGVSPPPKSPPRRKEL